MSALTANDAPKEGGDVLVETTRTDLSEEESTSRIPTTTGTSDRAVEEKNVFGIDHAAVPAHFWNVGLVMVASIAILYPVLIIEYGASSAVYTGASQLVTLFYSYQIFFGIFTDAFHIFRRRWKPYMMLGWTLSSAALLAIVIVGRRGMSDAAFVWLLTIANIGAAIADTAASGFLTWISHHEPQPRKGHAQTAMYIMKESGRLVSNIVVLIGFSGPLNCDGYPEVTECDNAKFPFDMSLSQFAAVLFAFTITGAILIVPLREDPAEARDNFKALSTTLSKMWIASQNKAVWQLMLFTMISNTLFSIYNPAQYNANYVWLNLTTFQNQLVWLIENVVFIVGLWLIKRYFLNTSWRKLNLIGMGIVSTMNLLYLLIVYDICRKEWFYIVFSTTESFMYTANFLVNVFCIIEVAGEGLEAVTYALITSATAATYPLATAVSLALLSFFPILNEQDSLSEDTPAVRNAMASLIVVILVLNWSGVLAMPMLPRQREETRELVKKNEKSKLWAAVALIAGLCAIIYSTIITIFSARGGCAAIFGGPGCDDGNPGQGLFVVMAVIFGFCYCVPFYHVYWPILMRRESFRWSIFV